MTRSKGSTLGLAGQNPRPTGCNSAPRPGFSDTLEGMKRSVLITACALGALAAAPVAAADYEMFTSPSGNIGCIIGEGSVRCDIDERDWTPPARPADCPSQTGYGQGITLGVHGKASFVCAGDTALGGGSALAYGQHYASDGISCTSEQAGMRCSNADDHGFTIARDAYTLF